MAAHPALLRLIALDLDGTLLNAEHRVSDASVEALRSLSRRGVRVALCSGRSPRAMQAHAERLSLRRGLPMVCFNGAAGYLTSAETRWTEDATPLFTSPVTDATVSAVLRAAEEAGLLVQYYVNRSIVVACRNDDHRAFTQRYKELTHVDAHVYEDSYERARAEGPPYKLLVMTHEPDGTVELMRSVVTPSEAKVIRGTPPWFVEILGPVTNKGEGLRRMCEALHLDLESCVAFGDGDNDIEFVTIAGLGVAMKNARPTLKEVADRITEATNDENGVAKELHRLEEEGRFFTTAPRNVVLKHESKNLLRAVVVRAETSDVVPLREIVMYPGRKDMCILDEDDGAIHLAARAPRGDAQSVDCDGDGASSSDATAAIVGVITLVLKGDRAQFRKLAVLPDWQGIGVGSALISVAAAEATVAGCKRLFCHARLNAEQFYAKLGFARRGDPFNKYGKEISHVEMEIVL